MSVRSKRLVAVAIPAVAVISFPVLAFASEPAAAAAGHEAEGGGVGISLLFPSLLEWIPMLIGFIVLWIVLAKKAWPVFIGMIDKRAATIKDSLEQAEAARVESAKLLEAQKAQLDDAREQATQIIADARSAAELVRSDIEAKAAEEAETMLKRARAGIEAEKQAAIAELRSSVADISVSVAGKLIGRNLDEQEHRRIIEQYVNEAGSFDDN
ncbi:MAG: F0F1 ATP synthase subunit B [Actinomycetia bacterium]|nr:F0F1 ATP synthase subunit B [Actinomycetes bacterium]